MRLNKCFQIRIGLMVGPDWTINLTTIRIIKQVFLNKDRIGGRTELNYEPSNNSG